jgi:SOS-response transcriptional repressor LexA
MNNIKKMGARVAWALKQKNIPASTVSVKLGWSVSYLGKVISGEIEELGFLRGIQLAEFLGIDPHWLATGEMRSEILLIKAGKRRAIADNPNSPLLASYVPLISWQEAGKRIKSSYAIKDKRAYPAVQMTANAGLGAFALTMDGDSMADNTGQYISINTDDIVFFDPDERPYIGCCVLARMPNDDAAILRRLDIDCGKLYLIAHNKRFPATELKDKSIIFAVLVERITPFSQKSSVKIKKMKYLDDLL